MRYFRIFLAAIEVRRAIVNTGSHPGYHTTIMNRHRKEWPTLWRALDKLVEAVNEEAR